MATNSIYIANQSTVSGIATGSTLPVGSVVNKSGCGIGLNGSNLTLNFTGTYSVYATFTVTPSASDTVTIQAYKDGVAIPGAKASISSDSIVTLPLAFSVKHCCCRSTSNIYFVISTLATATTITQSNAAITAFKNA